MPEFSGAQGIVLAPQPQQCLHVLEHGLLFTRAALARERVLRIFGPAAGKVVPIVRISASRQADFIAVIKLRYTTQRQCESVGKLQLGRRHTRNSSESRYVVIAEKRHEEFRMGVQRVLPQNIGQVGSRSVSE